MATLYWHTYTVMGHGRFPVDMLRYDCAHPVDGQSAGAILDEVDGLHGNPRTVLLRSHRPPTVARWASFGWRVNEREIHKSKVVS